MPYTVTTTSMPDQPLQNQAPVRSNTIPPHSISLRPQPQTQQSIRTKSRWQKVKKHNGTPSAQAPQHAQSPKPYSNNQSPKLTDPTNTSPITNMASTTSLASTPAQTQNDDLPQAQSATTQGANSAPVTSQQNQVAQNQPFPSTQQFPRNYPAAQPFNPQQPAQDPYGWDDWGYGNDQQDDLGGGMGGLGGLGGGLGGGFGGGPAGYASGQTMGQRQLPRQLTPEERITMIESVYEEILCRKPDTRDINYYKYSTLNDDQIKKQLIASAEHKEMMGKGREYTKLKDHAEQLETRVRMLEVQIKDQVEEFRELANLLQEKNRHLELMRANCMPRTIARGGDFTYSAERSQPPANRAIEIESQNQSPTTQMAVSQGPFANPPQNTPSETVGRVRDKEHILQQIQDSKPQNIIFTDQNTSLLPPDPNSSPPLDTQPESGSSSKRFLNSIIRRIL